MLVLLSEIARIIYSSMPVLNLEDNFIPAGLIYGFFFPVAFSIWLWLEVYGLCPKMDRSGMDGTVQ